MTLQGVENATQDEQQDRAGAGGGAPRGREPADQRPSRAEQERRRLETITELVRQVRADGDSLTGPRGLLKDLTRMVLEVSLEEEMTEHLGHSKHQLLAEEPGGEGQSRHVRNGSRTRTVMTGSVGMVEITVPRDRAGTFEPVIVPKHARKLGGVEVVVLSLTAKGLSTGEISAHLDEIYGASVSKDTIGRITDRVSEEMNEWLARPLDPVYAAIFIDAIVVKVRDGQVADRPFYAAIGVSVDGRKDVLGPWAGSPGDGEGAKYWLAVLTGLRNRGVTDTMFVVCDGLKGLPEVVSTTWPDALVQTYAIHLLRNSFRLTSRKHWDQIARDLELVSTAPSAHAARTCFEAFTDTWGKRYPAVIRLWTNAWEEFTPFLAYGACRRMPCPRRSGGLALGELSMARDYRPVLRDQVSLLPPDMRDWLPDDHLVWFVLDVIETLDVSAFEVSRRRGGVGAAGYDPRMLLGLLVYSYCRGVRSSRQIERLCHTDIAFKVLCAADIPDHATIARFRAVSEDAFVGLFAQVLMIAARAGLARFGTIAIDGTKILANASIDANRGRDWFDQHAAQVAASIADEAATADAVEDAKNAHEDDEADGDRVPAVLADRSDRAARIRRASSELTALTQQHHNESDARQKAARARLKASQADAADLRHRDTHESTNAAQVGSWDLRNQIQIT